MSTRVFKGNPKWKNGIPMNSKIRIETLPAQTVVYENDRVSEQVNVDLDPGFYHAVIKKYIGKNAAGRLSQIRWEERFFHDITEQEYTVLSGLRPQHASARMTSNGWVFACGFQGGCEYYCNNPMAMVLHELKHRGLTKEDVMQDSDYVMDQQANTASVVPPPSEKKRGPGRPRSFHSET